MTCDPINSTLWIYGASLTGAIATSDLSADFECSHLIAFCSASLLRDAIQIKISSIAECDDVRMPPIQYVHSVMTSPVLGKI